MMTRKMGSAKALYSNWASEHMLTEDLKACVASAILQQKSHYNFMQT